MSNSKFLINSDFVAIRKGEFVSADEESGEFILDTANVTLSKGQLEEVAAANKLKINSKLNAKKFEVELVEKLNKLKIDEVNKMTPTEIVKGIVEAGFAAEKTDEEMLVEIIQAGIKFKDAGKLFQKASEEGGYRVNSKNRKESVAKILDEDEFSPEHWDEVQSKIDQIVAEISGTEEKVALSLIKSWCKVNEVVLPKKTKEAKAPKDTKILGFLSENVTTVTVEELAEFISEQKPEFEEKKVKTMAAKFFKYVEFARSCFSDESESADEAA